LFEDRPIRWGILGTGAMAAGFVQDLKTVQDAELYAVGSRAEATAQRFATAYGVRRAHTSYEALVADPEVDIVYVATPHSRHRDDCLLALDAGKPVLCEKPFALNASQAREVIERARERGLFCMEAMWTRFLPILTDVRDRVLKGEIGELQAIFSDFGHPVERRDDNRFLALELGGGALLDRGIYGVALAHWFFGPPAEAHGVAKLARTGVDEQFAAVLGWDDGRVASLTGSMAARTHNTATLVGTTGSILLHEPFWCPPGVTIRRFGAPTAASSLPRSLLRLPGLGPARRVLRGLRGRGRHFRAQLAGRGYRYEAIEAMRCLRLGNLESDFITLDETLEVMQTLDRLRAPWGLVYPQESRPVSYSPT
jgi:predicted dehydrogenase